LFYKIASVLLLLFTSGHTLGFRQIDPSWKVDSLVASMQSTHFQAQGLIGRVGIFVCLWVVSVLLLLAAVITRGS
jgi:hypothetical protein